tara:strand:+ start:205 stop:1530 length:1326 start_codon:yes stop_codon:yes gene_type:complete
MAVLLGSKNLSVIEEVVLTSSQTYTARRTGIADVICIGGGGQGGSSGNGNVGTTKLNLTGGGAGGYSRKRIPITAGDTFTVVVGAGGQASSTKLPGAGNLTAGSAGGESTFDHASATANIALDSNGGGGGLANTTGTASGATYAGGAGGTATGGDVNFTGGRGGTITRSNNSSNVGCFTTGGGAVAVLGTAFNGGDVNFTSSGATTAATGGAGIGGNGGNVAYDNGSGASQCASGGGSAGGEGNGFTSAHTSATTNPLTAFAKTDLVLGGGRLPSHGGNGISTNVSTLCVAGNGGTGGLRAYQAGLGDGDFNSIFGGNEKPTEVIDSAVGPGSLFTSNAALYPQPTGPGGGGGGASGTAGNNHSNSVIAAGNGAAFAGGGGAASLVDNSEIANTSENISSSGRGGIGGGGSGGCYLGTNVSNATIEWASGGDGVVIIRYLG